MIWVEMTYMVTLVVPTAKFFQFPFTFFISWYKYMDFSAAKIEISILDNYNVELK